MKATPPFGDVVMNLPSFPCTYLWLSVSLTSQRALSPGHAPSARTHARTSPLHACSARPALPADPSTPGPEVLCPHMQGGLTRQKVTGLRSSRPALRPTIPQPPPSVSPWCSLTSPDTFRVPTNEQLLQRSFWTGDHQPCFPCTARRGGNDLPLPLCPG